MEILLVIALLCLCVPFIAASYALLTDRFLWPVSFATMAITLIFIFAACKVYVGAEL